MNRNVLGILSGLLLIAVSCTEQPAQSPGINDKSQAETAQNPDPAHTSQNALDYWGTYSGTLPCADCEGIQTELVLNEDMTFVRKQTYLGKPEPNAFKEEGSFQWNDAGSDIQLLGAQGASQYKVGENILWQLDLNGERITGELAEHYTLRK